MNHLSWSCSLPLPPTKEHIDVKKRRKCRKHHNKQRSISFYESRRGKPLKIFFLLILLLSGDIEINPGPSFKYPCGRCERPVKSNQKGIQCDLCDKWYHVNCEHISSESYHLLANNTDEWFCGLCSLPPLSDSFFEVPPPEPFSPGQIEQIIEPTTSLNLTSKDLFISHLNIRSLLPKLDELRTFLHEYKCAHLFGVSETWLTDSVCDGLVGINGFQTHRRDRGGRGGGLLVYVSEHVTSIRRRDLEDPEIEALWIQVKIKKSWLTICNTYRPRMPIPYGWIEWLV